MKRRENMDTINPKPGHRSLRKGRVSLPNHAYLVTTTTLNREPFFVDFEVACAAARCFEKPEILGDAQMLAWVLMPDHLHWLIQLGQHDALSLVVNRLKSFSARMANHALQREGQFWARRTMTTRCVRMRICVGLPVILWQIHYAHSWSNTLRIIHFGMRLGCE